ncbi:hypothetical protein FPCIR_14107 [Fusarium pseudocircinatum]|uniref:Uncharacterized protein n=1 Tax=Fusarium pseudocircinatum TaxID=56676 RepID=A0A8H5KEY9_9HYPO|nr:hypothetical protein FPCIR_14107 [Fusarium pseudocircinatum]
MSDRDLTQTHYNAVQGITQQLEHLAPSPQGEQTKGEQAVRKRHLGKHCVIRGSFVGGSDLLRKAAYLTIFHDVSLDLCFWDRSCSSWVGVKPQHSRLAGHNIRDFEDGRAMLRKRLRSLHEAIDGYVKKYDVPYRLEFLDPFEEQREVSIRVPDGLQMDFQDWKYACESHLPPEARSRERTRRIRTRQVSKASREGENTNIAEEQFE